MSSLHNILNPEAQRGTPQGSGSENPMSPAEGLSPPPHLEGPKPPESMASHYSMDYLKGEHEPHPDCPDTLDCLPDTDGRPQHTLPVILRCAILGSPKRRLTIREIYSAMEAKYPYYKTAGPTWKQSVRHHLSLNRLFERQPRPVTDPGFGSYWTVNLAAPPGTKRPRKRGRQAKGAADGVEDATPKKRGRPRRIDPGSSKAALSSRLMSSMIPTERDMRQAHLVSSMRTHNGEHSGEDDEDELDEEEDDDAYESEEDMVYPFPQRGRSRMFGPPDSGVVTGTLSRAKFDNYDPMGNVEGDPAFGPFADRSRYQQGASPNTAIERLQIENASLRRQSADSLAAQRRLSEDLAKAQAEVARRSSELANAQAEVSRARATLRSAESMLEEETRKRREAERAVEDEARLRRIAEEKLRQKDADDPMGLT